MGTFLISLITGIVAGALSARYVVRYELDRAAANAKAAAPVPVPAPVVASPPPVVVAPPPMAAPLPAPVVAAPAPAPHDLELSPEILTVLTAAVAAFLGKRARIRSARVRPSGAMDSAWAQQGRVFVQASHNLSMSRH